MIESFRESLDMCISQAKSNGALRVLASLAEYAVDQSSSSRESIVRFIQEETKKW